jgi:hypothetical protein
MSFIYCHLNFHANLLRPRCFPLRKRNFFIREISPCIRPRFSDTDFQKNDEGGGERVFNFCIYMHIGPIFRFHFIDCYHSELLEVTTSYNQRKTQECSEFLQLEIGVVSTLINSSQKVRKLILHGLISFSFL